MYDIYKIVSEGQTTLTCENLDMAKMYAEGMVNPTYPVYIYHYPLANSICYPAKSSRARDWGYRKRDTPPIPLELNPLVPRPSLR